MVNLLTIQLESVLYSSVLLTGILASRLLAISSYWKVVTNIVQNIFKQASSRGRLFVLCAEYPWHPITDQTLHVCICGRYLSGFPSGLFNTFARMDLKSARVASVAKANSVFIFWSENCKGCLTARLPAISRVLRFGNIYGWSFAILAAFGFAIPSLRDHVILSTGSRL